MTKTKNETIFLLDAPWDNPYQGDAKRVLFVCSAGILRSATAAHIANQIKGWNTRSCGSESYALIPASVNLLTWAQKIYFVNQYNYDVVIENFDGFLDIEKVKNKSVVWDIEDHFDYMSHTLVNNIKTLLKDE
jgi:predicted protein tyrosine phosphatase